MGITPERMRILEQITKSLTAGKTKVAECLHAIASANEFTEYERTYVTFKFTEQIAGSLRSTVADPGEPLEEYVGLLEGYLE